MAITTPSASASAAAAVPARAASRTAAGAPAAPAAPDAPSASRRPVRSAVQPASSTASLAALARIDALVAAASAADTPLPTADGSAPPAAAAAAAPKRKSRWWWLQRDSLARRLFIGKPGSRRRNRFDNNNFTDHPLAPSKDPNFVHEWDQHPGLILPTRPTLFSSITFAADRRAFVNVSPDHVLGVEIRSTSDDDNDNDKESLVPVFAGESHLTRADRRLRLQLRKFPCNEEEEAVRRFEIMIISFVTESLGNAAHKDIVRAPSLDERSIDSIQSLESVDSDDLWDAPETHDLDNGWIRLDARGPTDAAESPALASEPSVPGEMRLVLTDSFLRLLVHTVCRYYMLVSFSKDMPDGQRVTYIRNPHAMGNGRRHASNYNLPAVSFSDFIFA